MHNLDLMQILIKCDGKIPEGFFFVAEGAVFPPVKPGIPGSKGVHQGNVTNIRVWVVAGMLGEK